jgi:hypothetical protein
LVFFLLLFGSSSFFLLLLSFFSHEHSETERVGARDRERKRSRNRERERDVDRGEIEIGGRRNSIHHGSGGFESWDPEKEVAGEGENQRARDPGDSDPPMGDASYAILGGSPCKTRDHDPNRENPCDPILTGDFRQPETEIRRWRSFGGT